MGYLVKIQKPCNSGKGRGDRRQILYMDQIEEVGLDNVVILLIKRNAKSWKQESLLPLTPSL